MSGAIPPVPLYAFMAHMWTSLLLLPQLPAEALGTFPCKLKMFRSRAKVMKGTEVK
jgi:hypothetical protein